MSLIDDFLLSGNDEVDTDFGTSTMVCNGQTFPVLMDSAPKSFEGALGGLEADMQISVMAQPSDVSNPYNMLQKRCTVDGIAYRVAIVDPGTVSIRFALTATNDSR